jgi:hypothetical protein
VWLAQLDIESPPTGRRREGQKAPISDERIVVPGRHRERLAGMSFHLRRTAMYANRLLLLVDLVCHWLTSLLLAAGGRAPLSPLDADGESDTIFSC